MESQIISKLGTFTPFGINIRQLFYSLPHPFLTPNNNNKKKIKPHVPILFVHIILSTGDPSS